MNEGSRPISQTSSKFTLVEDGNHNSDTEHTNKEDFNTKERAPADFEEAITACGYGKFHYIILLGLIPVSCAQIFSSGSVSYVLPTAECDLQLTDFHKGVLNAGVYVGMILASFFWGFASDIYGRRKLLVAGFLLDSTFNFLTSVAHSFWLLLILKIFGGTAITGPNALVYSYLAEIHDNAHRQKVIMISGAFVALAQVIQPAMAYLIIPLQFRFEIIPGVMDFTSWRLFLAMSSLPSFLSSIVFLSVPESPKFLMSRGRTCEALDSFRVIYARNTGEPRLSYPIKELQAPPKQAASSAALASSPSSGGITAVIRSGWIQVRPIFRPPYLNVALLVFTIQIFIMICLNSLRLWIPQIFTTLDEATTLAVNNPLNESTTAKTICDLLGSIDSRTAAELGEEGHTCPPINGEVYLRSLVIGITTTLSFFISTLAVGYVGKKTIVKTCFPLAAAMGISMSWATNSDMFTALVAIYTALMGNALTAMNSLTVDLFPTAFRSMALSMTLMCGRIASLLGNLLFPVLFNLSCSAVFFSIGCVLAVNGVLVWLIPNRIDAH